MSNHLVEIVNPIVDHKRRFARAEPLALFFRDVPNGKPLVLGFVIRPFQNRTTEAFKRHAQMLLIPGYKRDSIVSAFEKDAADSGNSRHRCLHPALHKKCFLDRKSTRLNSSHGYISYA